MTRQPQPDDNELAIISEPAAASHAAALAPKPRRHRLWHVLAGSRKRRLITLGTIVLLTAAIIGFTNLKYVILGPVVKSSLVVTVRDGATGQLLPEAKVTVAGVSTSTDKTGTVHLTHLHPGPTTLTVSKSAYAATSSHLTLGFGHNDANTVRLTSTGIKLAFSLTNLITGQPVSGARVTVGDADAVSGSDGNVVASVSPVNLGQSIAATVSADGYNDLSLPVEVAIDAKAYAAALTPAGNVFFLSNRSGTIDLYQSGLDGSNAHVVLAGTGHEDQSTGLLPNVYDQSVLAMVSSRSGRLEQGQLAEDLYIFHAGTGELKLVDANVNFGNFRTWLGQTLVYEKGTYSPTLGYRSLLMAYSVASGQLSTITACTPDGACPHLLYATDDLVLYAMSGAPPSSSANGLFAVKRGATASQRLSNVPAQNALRQTLGSLMLSYYNSNQTYPGNVWQTLDLTTTKVSPLASGPSLQTSRTYVSSPGDKWVVSVDNRDGRSDLYLQNADGSGERKLTNLGSVNQFVQWYGDDYVVFSSTKTGENALYVVGVAGGEPHKVADFYAGNARTYSGGYNPGY